MKYVGIVVGVTAAMSFLGAPAHAAVTEYTNAAAFNSVVTGAVTYNFEGIAPVPINPGDPNYLSGAQTIGGTGFSSSGIPFVIDASGTANYGASFFSGQSPDFNIPSDVIVTLAGTKAISFEYGAYITTPGSPVTIVLNGGATFVQNLPLNPGTGTNFVGFVSDTPITSISFSTITGDANAGPDYGYSLDVVHFTLATPVPEPGSYAMMLAGLGMLGFISRRRNQDAA